MADLESVLADVSYLMAMEKSKSTPSARATKKIVLPDPSVANIYHRYLSDRGCITFESIFNQCLGYQLFREFCHNGYQGKVTPIDFYEKIKEFEKLHSLEDQLKLARDIYDNHIMKELLARSHFFSAEAADSVRLRLIHQDVSSNLFEAYHHEIKLSLCGQIFEKFLKSEYYTRFLQWKCFEINQSLSLADFNIHRILGRGGFGEVYGARKTDTGKMFAIKSLDKKRVKMKQGEQLAMNEREVLAKLNCPFIVCMTYAVMNPEKLFFVLDLMNGGDLHYHLSQRGAFKEEEVKFYIAEVTLGLDHLHSRFICYRDLKPANILLDENGHIKISDLGLACNFAEKKPHSCVGTHGYMAPEVIKKGVSYDSSCDWFSLGCMMYKLLTGQSPFRGNKTEKKQDVDYRTLNEEPDLSFTPNLKLRQIIDDLMKKNPSERLGCRGRGALEIKEHPYFEDFGWKLAENFQLSPPLIPPRGEVNAADAFDIGSFNEDDTRGIKLTEEEQSLFKDFPFVHSDLWQQEISETVFDMVNQETDKLDIKRNLAFRPILHALGEVNDCILYGYLSRMVVGGPLSIWHKKFCCLFPNRLELFGDSNIAAPMLLPVDEIKLVDELNTKGSKCFRLLCIDDRDFIFKAETDIEHQAWFKEITASHCSLISVQKSCPKLFRQHLPDRTSKINL